MTPNDAIIPFLQQLGVEAFILPDAIYGNLITINTQQYESKQRQIDAWFTRVRQIGKHSYFVIRMRGTDSSA